MKTGEQLVVEGVLPLAALGEGGLGGGWSRVYFLRGINAGLGYKGGGSSVPKV